MEALNLEYPSAGPEIQNLETVESLYKALDQQDTSMVAKLVERDLEWWFHGPPRCQHMKRLLTGEPWRQVGFRFKPGSLEVIGRDCVVAEGWEGPQVYWVHVWKLKNGLAMELREYFNTWLTVMDCSGGAVGWNTGLHTVWESMPRDLPRGSLPSLLLAI